MQGNAVNEAPDGMILGTEVEYLICEEVSSPLAGSSATLRSRGSHEALAGVLNSIPAEYLLCDEPLNPRYNGFILQNGGRLYIDGSFLEYATPECLNVRQLLAYEKAGDLIAGAGLKAYCHKTATTLRLYKMISDVEPGGEIPGYHENYGLRQDRYFNLFMENFWPREVIRRVLIPFLVTRQLFAGAGALVSGGTDVHFELSQRAMWIETVFNYTASHRRPILQLKRPDLSEKYLRVHISCGDPNIADWSTFLKIGTTAVMLACLGQGVFSDVDLELTDSIQAFKTVSRKGSVALNLKAGGQISAIDIQETLLQKVRGVEDRIVRPRDLEWEPITEVWGDTLRELQRYPWKSLANGV